MISSFRALYFNLVGLICILSLCCGVGLVIFAKYYACDPVKLGLIKQSDQVCQFPHISTRQQINKLLCSIALSIVRHGNVKAF